jgi:phosphopantetheine--protein transferase-like protein
VDIESVVEVIPIADIEGHLEDTLLRCFSEPEQQRFENRPARTIAGQVALKAAVRGLAQKALGAGDIALEDIDITRGENGAPRIRRVSTADADVNEVLENRVLVSISHSRVSAVGLAVLARG